MIFSFVCFSLLLQTQCTRNLFCWKVVLVDYDNDSRICQSNLTGTRPKYFFSHYAWEPKICALPVNKHVAHIARENICVSNRIPELEFHTCTFGISKKVCGQKKLKISEILQTFHHFYELEFHACILRINKKRAYALKSNHQNILGVFRLR